MARRPKKDYRFFWEEPWDDFLEVQKRMREDMRKMLSFDEPFTFQFRMPRLFRGVRFAETEDKIVVRAELPGFDKKDIELMIEEDKIHIKAERKTEKREKRKGASVFESRIGKMEKTFSLPTKVNPDNVDARMSNGVLEIVLQKLKPKKKGKKVVIK